VDKEMDGEMNAERWMDRAMKIVGERLMKRAMEKDG
jgi:hypothetical protein